MNKWKLGGGGICLVTSILLILIALGYFFFQPGTSEISDKIDGNSNVINNSGSKEISLFHIENFNSQVSDLKDHVNKHHAVKYSLITVLVVVIVMFMINKCKKIPRKIKEKMERKDQDEKIENHHDTLIEMGMLKPKRKPKKVQEVEEKKKKEEEKKKHKEPEVKKKSKNEKRKKWVEIEVSGDEEETETACLWLRRPVFGCDGLSLAGTERSFEPLDMC